MNTRVPSDGGSDYNWRQPLERVEPPAPPAPPPPRESEFEKDDWLPDGVRKSIKPPAPTPASHQAEDTYLD